MMKINLEAAKLLSRSQRYRLRKKGVDVPFVTKREGRKLDADRVRKKAESQKRGRFFNCLICDTQFWRKPSAIKTGDCKFCCRGCYFKWQSGRQKSDEFKERCRGRTGDKSATWKGGITPENMRIRGSTEYRDWRKSVFLRDMHTCQDCRGKSEKGKTVYLHAHHLKSFSEYIELRFEVSNGITLCKKCHYARHTKH